jgi:transglutaminase-like putative cysteine protease
MSWRLRVTHRTGLSYAGEVVSSYNEARMTPQTNLRQTVWDARVTVNPGGPSVRYLDYWGTQVTAFDRQAPHDRLTVVATAVVETFPEEPSPAGAGWTALASPAATDRWHEFLLPTGRTALDDELTEHAAGFRASAEPASAARAACEWVHDNIAYQPGSTGVHTSALEAWRERQGVCQDISHLTVGLIRAMGVPARYVSGYLHPRPDTPVGEPVVGQSHAWVEWWDGAWHGFDPTNGTPIGLHHVVIGTGRDYADVSPLKGVYAGPESTALGVEVEVTRVR